MLGTVGSLILLAVILALVALVMVAMARGNAGKMRENTVSVIIMGSAVAAIVAIAVATVVAA